MRKLLFSITKKDLKVDYFRAGGKGGQHQNKSSTGVRITHIESGAKGEARDSKSQLQNRKAALTRLVASPKFKMWKARKIFDMEHKEAIERAVQEAMRDENLQVEVFRDGKWQAWTD